MTFLDINIKELILSFLSRIPHIKMNITFLGFDNEITFSSEQEILHLCLRCIVFYKVLYTISIDLNWDNIQSK